MKQTITNEHLIVQYRKESCPIKKEWLREDFFSLNRPFAYFIAKKHKHEMIEEEELTAVALMGMIKAFNAFDTEKNIKFVTYASYCMSNEILMFFRNKSRYWQHVPLDVKISEDAEDSDTTRLDLLEDPTVNVEETSISAVTLNEVKNIAKEILDEREYYLFQNMLDENRKSQLELSALLNLSQSYIGRLEKKVIRKIRVYINLMETESEVTV